MNAAMFSLYLYASNRVWKSVSYTNEPVIIKKRWLRSRVDLCERGKVRAQGLTITQALQYLDKTSVERR